MTDDPILDEIHRTRAKLLAECGGSRERYFERLRVRSLANPNLIHSLDELPKEPPQLPDAPYAFPPLDDDDPIVREIHQARAKLWAEAGGDMDRYLKLLRARERNNPNLVHSLGSLRQRRAKKPVRKAAARKRAS